MKRYSLLIAGTLIAAVAALHSAPAFSQEGGYKIGVVDMRQCLQDYNKREAKYKELEQEVTDLQNSVIVPLQTKIRTLREQHQAEADPEKKRQIEEDHNRAAVELETEMRLQQQKIDELEQDTLQELLNEVKAAVDAIGQEGNYHLVLDSGSPAGAVIYSSQTLEITPQVIQRLNSGS